MDIIQAREAPANELDTLLGTNQTIDQEKLAHSGYVIRQDDKLEGCFVLEKTYENNYWLRQMYLSKHAVISLPALLESVIAIATRKQAESVVIYSHQKMLDTILEALSFSPQKEEESFPVDNLVENHGKWWEHRISSQK